MRSAEANLTRSRSTRWSARFAQPLHRRAVTIGYDAQWRWPVSTAIGRGRDGPKTDFFSLLELKMQNLPVTQSQTAMPLSLAQWLTDWSKSSAGQTFFSHHFSKQQILPQMQRLRRQGLSPEQAAAVIELWELRVRGQEKFAASDSLFFTRRGLEQASGQTITQWKIRACQAAIDQGRLPQKIVLLDLCCGVGGDLLQWRRQFPVLGIDADPAIAHFAQQNLEAQTLAVHETGEPPSEKTDGRPGPSPMFPAYVICARVESLLGDSQPLDGTCDDRRSKPQQTQPTLPTIRTCQSLFPPAVIQWCRQHNLLDHHLFWHLDPDRRSDAGRHVRLEDFSPGEDFLKHLLLPFPGGMIKVAPATEVSPYWQSQAGWTWVGWQRECKQLLGMFGLSDDKNKGGDWRSVTVFNRQSEQWEDWFPPTERPPKNSMPELRICSTPKKFLFETHAALYAAGLAESLAQSQGWYQLRARDYFSSDQLPDEINSGVRSALYDTFEVRDVLPLRSKAIAKRLKALNLRLIEIKKRHVAASVQHKLIADLKSAFGLDSPDTCSLLIFQESGNSDHGTRLQVAIGHRIGSGGLSDR